MKIADTSFKWVSNGLKQEKWMIETLREKCPYSELFWSAFSCIRTEHREILNLARENIFSCAQNCNITGHKTTSCCFCLLIFTSSHQRSSMQKNVLTNFTKFRGKHLRKSLFFNKVTGLRPATSLKKRLWHRCFSVNFVKFLRTPFYRTPLDDCFLIFWYFQKIPEIPFVSHQKDWKIWQKVHLFYEFYFQIWR